MTGQHGGAIHHTCETERWSRLRTVYKMLTRVHTDGRDEGSVGVAGLHTAEYIHGDVHAPRGRAHLNCHCVSLRFETKQRKKELEVLRGGRTKAMQLLPHHAMEKVPDALWESKCN